MTQLQAEPYYVPGPSPWPGIAGLGLFILFVGAGNWLHFNWYGPYLFFLGLSIIIFVLFGWLGAVVQESQSGRYNEQADLAFRRGMKWFILSEVFFFAAFFSALLFTRYWSVPLLGGEINSLSQLLIWPDFNAAWPLLTNPDNQTFAGARIAATIDGIPTLNTLLLLTSGVTLTLAHRALRRGQRALLLTFMVLTVSLGLAFLCAQAIEYYQSYTERGLTLNAGVYGSLFYFLTGFHGAHVTLGTIMLIVIAWRCSLGHFSAENHFAFEGVAWYWHFVDAVWIMLYFLVYWL